MFWLIHSMAFFIQRDRTQIFHFFNEKIEANRKETMANIMIRFDLVWFGLVSLFDGISTFAGYLMPKPFF